MNEIDFAKKALLTLKKYRKKTFVLGDVNEDDEYQLIGVRYGIGDSVTVFKVVKDSQSIYYDGYLKLIGDEGD